MNMIRLLHAERRSPTQDKFDAARTLRAAGWSHWRIHQALGITLGQVRCAVDAKAQAASERWSA